jgi:hypothetical protein
LEAVAHFEEDLVLYIDSEDEISPATLCVKANFDTQHFDSVQPMAVYLELFAFQPIQDADTQISYRKRIQKEMNPNEIAMMLNDFTQKQLHNL